MTCSCQPNNQPVNNPRFNKWHGIDRAPIDWQPEIDESKCIGCGLCATTCGRRVYKFDYENKKSKAANPKKGKNLRIANRFNRCAFSVGRRKMLDWRSGYY